ncbi:MAG: hypothetical protein K0U98_16545 [Deltaproteobacteria bacterium]|nr:hypothetical protein [Deltaproteobacteria bacterium]
MKRPTALAAVFGLFVAGIITGLLGTHLFYSHQIQEREGPLWFMGHPPLGHLSNELQLTEEQQEKANIILRESRRRGEEIRREIRPQLHQLMDQTHESLLGLLTEEQKQRFQELKFHRRHEGNRRREHRRSPPGDLGPPGRRRPPGAGRPPEGRRHRRHPSEPHGEDPTTKPLTEGET